MTKKEYNSWTNYETRCVHLWLTNDKGSDNYWREQAEMQLKNAIKIGNKGDAAYVMAEQLEEEHNENTPEVTGVYADLLHSALSEVNWLEIAESFLNDVESDNQ